MPFMTEWSTPDRRRLVVLSADAIATFRQFRQKSCRLPEAGGILLGHRRRNHIEVIAATEPASTDRRSRFLFERGAQGHSQAAARSWKSAAFMVDYVGEWHTHPQSVPVPSSIDRAEWSKLTRSRPGISMILLIVGTRGLYVELSTKDEHQLLTPIS